MTTTDKNLDLLKIAARNVCDGVLYEPRLYCALFDFSDAESVTSILAQPDIFRNGEQSPVRITHLVAAVRYEPPEEQQPSFPPGDERAIQQYGMRVRAHDTFYMNPSYVPLPLWHNQVSAASDVVTRGQSSWRFAKPVIMGKRDTIEVKFALESPIPADSGTRRVSVAFSGVGLYSRRPKQLYSYVDVTTANGISTVSLPSDQFRNTGAEPLEIYEMSAAVAGLSLASDPVGEIRLGKLSVRLTGNGTNQRWTITQDTSVDDLVPASLWSLTSGRAVVHKLPGEGDDAGWLWQPGVGLNIELSNLTARADQIYVAAIGYAIIP